jgi:hypothetical protein
MALTAMAFSLMFSFQHAFQLMGEHHETHVARDLHDHPAVMSHKIGTEPLEVSVRVLCLSCRHYLDGCVYFLTAFASI